MIKPTNLIPGVIGQLEIKHYPTGAKHWAVLCHPHPLYQGSMHNKVITSCAQACNEVGIQALCFNYRGVGHSEGEYGYIDGEVADGQAVIRWLWQHYQVKPSFIIGFSFGSIIAQKLCAGLTKTGLVMIAPPLRYLTGFDSPLAEHTQIIHGQADEIAAFEDTRAWVAQHPQQPRFIAMPNTSHFFHGKLSQLKQHLRQFLSENEHTDD